MGVMRDAIRDQHRLARMRQGQEVPDYVDIPSIQGVRVALVPLNEAELTAGLSYAAMDDSIPETFSGMQFRSRLSMQSDLWHACREPASLDEHVFESIESMVEMLDPSDFDYLNMHLAALMNYASPALDGMSEDDLDFLEQGWKAISLRELSGRQWAAAKVSLSILLPELLQGRLSGSTSTESSTPESESKASTSAASPS